ncbi:hypothetical protein [Paenibacillus prosopidis]|nr:hypothetical protein [Paenibacillus prosopidis]
MSGYMMFTELSTPLKLFGIRVFKDEKGHFWYKLGKNKRKRLI